MTSKEAIKFENFKLSKDNSQDINSGITILAISLIIFALPLLNILNLFSDYPSPNVYPTTFGDIYTSVEAIMYYFGFNILEGFTFISVAVVGWGIGGLVAAFIFGKDGKSGPLYASYIFLRFLVGVFLVILPALLLIDDEVMLTFLFFVVLFITSLPMIIISSISYRIGLWISPQY